MKLKVQTDSLPIGASRHRAGDCRYPLAPRDKWYGECAYRENGGRLVGVTPQEYLAVARPLEVDEVSRENIDILKDHIKCGGRLDPLLIRADGKEDGRHRAHAALELGLGCVPVIVYGDQFGDAPEIEEFEGDRDNQEAELAPQKSDYERERMPK